MSSPEQPSAQDLPPQMRPPKDYSEWPDLDSIPRPPGHEKKGTITPLSDDTPPRPGRYKTEQPHPETPQAKIEVNPMDRHLMDTKRPIGDSVAIGETRFNEDIAALAAKRMALGSDAIYSPAGLALSKEIRDLEAAKKLLEERAEKLSEHASVGMLESDVDAHIRMLKESLEQKLDKLRVVRPASPRWAAQRILSDPTPHEKEAMNGAQAEVDEYQHHLKIAGLVKDRLPRATVPANAA